MVEWIRLAGERDFRCSACGVVRAEDAHHVRGCSEADEDAPDRLIDHAVPTDAEMYRRLEDMEL